MRWYGGTGPTRALVAMVVVAVTAGCDPGSTGPEYVAKILLEPDSAHLEPGETASFQAVPLGPRDQEFRERSDRVNWSLSNDDVVELEVSGAGIATVTANDVGTSRLDVQLGRGEGSGFIFVRPPGLESIEIIPQGPVEIRRFSGFQARAILRDADGNQISPAGHRVSWGSSNPDILYIVPNTAATPFATVSGRQTGTARLQLVVGPFTTSITVRVGS